MIRLMDYFTLLYQGAFVDSSLSDELEGDVTVACPWKPVLKHSFTF